MKHLIISLQLLIITFITNGQDIFSSCIAPDSIVAKYRNDADQLALRKFYRNNLPYKDSIHISKSHSDTVTKALIAVYNATGLPARDTVTTIFNIHTFPNVPMNVISIDADSNLSWMQQLRMGNIPTGNAVIDSLISSYHLRLYYYSPFFHSVVFLSDSSYNMQALADLFKSIPEVSDANAEEFVGDGDNIWDSIYTDHVELIYSIGRGDCPAGCTFRRYWKFNVYFDCSVEYVGSYGDVLPNTAVNETEKKSVSIYPNPFNKQIVIDGLSKPFHYTVSNALGQILITGYSVKNELDNLQKLTSGFYILTIQSDEKVATVRILKE